MPDNENPKEWARKLSDKELLERVVGFLGTAALPRAVGEELKRRYNAKTYGPPRFRPRA